MLLEEPDWDAPTTTSPEPVRIVSGVLVHWGWPLGAVHDGFSAAMQEYLLSDYVTEQRLGIQLRGDKHPDLSEHADKTWWCLLTYCADVPIALRSEASQYITPSMAREKKSTIMWIDSVKKPDNFQPQNHLRDAIPHLSLLLIDGMKQVASVFQKNYVLPRATARHANFVAKEMTALNVSTSAGPSLRPAMTTKALSLVLPFLDVASNANASPSIALKKKLTTFGDFFLDHLVSPPLNWLTPGFHAPSMSTTSAIEAFMLQLAHKARVDVFHSTALLFRTALLYTPISKKKRKTPSVSFLYIHNTIEFDSPKSSSARRPIWIARKEAFAALKNANKHELIACLGEMNYITSAGNMGHVLRLNAAVTQLQGPGDSILDPSGVEVVIMVGPDLHAYDFYFASLANLHERLLRCQDGNNLRLQLQSLASSYRHVFVESDFPLIRSWLGLTPSDAVVHDPLGGVFHTIPDAIWESVEKDFGVSSTPQQMKIIQKIKGRCAWINCVAGNGKTTLLQKLAMYIIRKDANAFVWYATKSNAMLEDAANGFKRVLSRHEFLDLSVKQSGSSLEDSGWNFLQEVALDDACKDVQCLRMLDSIVDELWWLFHSNADERYRIAILFLLALRHEYLDFFYSAVQTRQDNAIQGLRVIASTTTQLVKANAQKSMWIQCLLNNQLLILLLDEAELVSAEENTAMSWMFDAQISVLDRYQSPWHINRAAATSECSNTLQMGSALRYHSAFDWAKEAGSMNLQENMETHRFGRSIVAVIKCVFPEEMKNLACPGPNEAHRNTAYLPILLADLGYYGDWEFYNSEILRSQTFFATLLVVLSHELVLKIGEGYDNTLLILWSLKQPMLQLQKYLEYAVPTQCRKLHELHGIPPPPDGYEAYNQPLTNLVAFKALQGAHGSDVDVTFLCTTTTSDDEDRSGWRGDEVEPHLIYEGLSRSKQRTYHFIEDLSAHIRFPSKELANAGKALNLKDSRCRRGSTNSLCKRQLRLVTLLRYAEKLLRQDTQQAPKHAHWTPRWQYTSAPNLLYNTLFPIALPVSSDLRYSIRRATQQDFYEDFYKFALNKFDEMRGYWPSTDSKSTRDRICFFSLVPSFHKLDKPLFDNMPLQFSSSAPSDFRLQLQPPAILDPGVDSASTSGGNPQDTQKYWRAIIEREALNATPARPPRKLLKYSACKKIFEDDLVSDDSSEDDTYPFPMRIWAIDCIAVHLVAAAKFDFALVMLPIAHQSLAKYTWKQLHTCLARVAAECYRLYKLTNEYRHLSTRGSISSRVGHHKAGDLEIASYRVIIKQCNSERPSFLLEFSDAQGEEVELMHLYPAMGLHHQHEGQQMLLGRMRSVTAAACLAVAAQLQWCLGEPILKNVSQDNDLKQKYLDATAELPQPSQPRIRGTLAKLAKEEFADEKTFFATCAKDATEEEREACKFVFVNWFIHERTMQE